MKDNRLADQQRFLNGVNVLASLVFVMLRTQSLALVVVIMRFSSLYTACQNLNLIWLLTGMLLNASMVGTLRLWS